MKSSDTCTSTFLLYHLKIYDLTFFNLNRCVKF